jgi:RHS repeat-associated protein
MNKLSRVVGALITCLLLSGCFGEDAKQTSPPPRPKAKASPTAPQEQAKPAEPAEPAEPETGVSLGARSPIAPAKYAPALASEIEDGLRLNVDPHTGELTVHELDLIAGPVTLRRARTSGFTADALFGRGWVSELDSCVRPLSEGYVVSRVQGLTFFAPVEDGLYVSIWGEIEFLHKAPDRFHLVSALDRTLEFSADGQLLSVTPGYRVERTQDAISLVTSAGTVALALNEGHVVSATAGGTELRYRYRDRELIEVRGALARRYQSTAGRLTRISTGRTTLLALRFDAEGRIDSANDARYTFESAGDVITSASMASPQGTWTYRLAPDAWVVDTPQGRGTVRFDERGLIASVRGPETGDQAPFAPSLPSTTPVTVTRDTKGRVASVAAGGAEERFAYDALGRLATRTRADGRGVNYTYDARGQVKTRTDAAGETVYDRDAKGRLKSVKSPEGRRWSMSYTGPVLASTEGPMGRQAMERDPLGRVIGLSVSGGRSLSISRDAHGRPTEVFSAEGGRQTWSYDENGLASMVASGSGATHRLDLEVGASAKAQHVAVTVDDTDRLSYTYAPKLEQLKSPWGHFRRSLDAKGNVHRLESPAGTFLFTYDGDGRRTGIRYPSGVVSLIKRDALGAEELRADNKEILFVAVARDARHEPREIVRNGESTYVDYDEAGRLEAWGTLAAGVTRYSYDADGNRASVAQGNGTKPSRLAYDSRGRLRRHGKERFVHDAAGRITTRTHTGGVDRFSYDGFGRLRSVKRAGKKTVRYTYDPLGRWATRTAGKETVRYVYDGDRLLAELGPGDRERVYVYGPGVDEPLAYSDGEGWVFLHTDELGSVLAYSNADGKRVDDARFAPFGEVITAPADATRPVFFAGRLHDPDTGLVNMRARVYDPSLGRFLTPDPAGLRGGLNAYVYVRNRPLTFTDPMGLWPGDSRDERPGFWGYVKQMAVGSAEGAKYLLAAAPGKALKTLKRVKASVVKAGHVTADLYGVNGTAAQDARAKELMNGTASEAMKSVKQGYEKAQLLTSKGKAADAARVKLAMQVANAADAAQRAIEKTAAVAWDVAEGSVDGVRYLVGTDSTTREFMAAKVDKAATEAVENVKGVVEGAGYVTGLYGDADAQAGAQESWAKDIMNGGAQSRALGAFDGYANGISMGLVDPNSKQFAFDEQQAQLGRKYGTVGAEVFGVASGLKEVPNAFLNAGKAIVNPRNAAKLFAKDLKTLPKQVRKAVSDAWANRQREVYDSAKNVLVRPFKNLGNFARGRDGLHVGGPFGQSLVDKRDLTQALLRKTNLARTAAAQQTQRNGARLADAVADMKVASGAARPQFKQPRTSARHSEPPLLDRDAVGVLGRLEGRQGSGKGIPTAATRGPRGPPARDTSPPSGLGDLSAREVRQIQEVVDEAGEVLYVTGSAAAGARRNPRSALPVGKDTPGGPGSTQSDIDYFTSTTKKRAFQDKDLDTRLPKIDDDRITGGVNPEKFGPHIEFRPGQPPRFVDGDPAGAARGAARREAARKAASPATKKADSPTDASSEAARKAADPADPGTADPMSASRPLGGRPYGARRMRTLRRYLDRRGVDLVEGPPGGGRFTVPQAGRPELQLPQNATEYLVWHELSHYRHYKKIGRDAYRALPRSKRFNAPERYVFDALERPTRRRRLNQREIFHARDYAERTGALGQEQ